MKTIKKALTISIITAIILTIGFAATQANADIVSTAQIHYSGPF